MSAEELEVLPAPPFSREPRQAHSLLSSARAPSEAPIRSPTQGSIGGLGEGVVCEVPIPHIKRKVKETLGI